MPIRFERPVRVLTQDEFRAIAYEVVGHAFAIHKEMGRFFDEQVYQNELHSRLGQRAEREFLIHLEYAGFRKTYRIDLLVDNGAVFEIKTASQLTNTHRHQLIQYLMMTGLQHGKLLNFRPEQVEHEFVNCSITAAERRQFQTRFLDWNAGDHVYQFFQSELQQLLEDWGTGLQVLAYEEALAHQLGGLDRVEKDLDVISRGRRIGSKRVNLLDPETAFRITVLQDDLESYRTHLLRLLHHTNLRRILWANIQHREIQLTAICKS